MKSIKPNCDRTGGTVWISKNVYFGDNKPAMVKIQASTLRDHAKLRVIVASLKRSRGNNNCNNVARFGTISERYKLHVLQRDVRKIRVTSDLKA